MAEREELRSYLESLRQEGGEGPRYSRFLKHLERKARVMHHPLCGQFELTPRCNLSCVMCYVRLEEDRLRGARLLTAEQWKALMREAYSAGMLEATLTGGECLAYPGFDEVFLFLQDLGCPITVMTNGVLLDEARLRFFEEHPPALLQVTLYGPDEETYERVTGRRVFQRVVENLRRVKAAGLPLALSVTPSRTLGEDVFETIRLAGGLSKEVFINTSLFTPEGETWRRGAEEDPDVEFYARVLRFRNELRGGEVREIPLEELPEPGGSGEEDPGCGLECGGGRSCFVIDWKGRMRICNRMTAAESVPELGFPEAWRRINAAAEAWPRVAECRGCPYEPVCDRCAAGFLQYAQPGCRPEEHCRRVRYLVSRGVLSASRCGL